MTRHAAIIATGSYLPPNRVGNDLLRERFAALGKPDVIGRFAAASGILQRWYADPAQATSDLAVEAGREALARAGLDAGDLDMVIVGTDTPDQLTPATATRVQAALGARRAGAFDIGCACASFPTAVANAAGLIATSPGIDRVLVIGAYLMQRLADPDDPMIFFYGDGAGAAVVARSDTPGVLASAFRADGRYADHWSIPAGGTREPATAAAVAAGRTRVRLHERYPPEINEAGWPALVETLATNGGFAVHELDAIVFTQINRSTIEAVCQRLAYPLERAPMIMDHAGYTGSACVPMALDHTLRDGRLAPGARVALVGSGVGYNMAAVAVRLTDPRLFAGPAPARCD